MNSSSSKESLALGVALCALALAIGCGRGALTQREYVWVAAPQVNLRDRVAALYNKVGTVKNGDRLEVLDRQKRFVKVRTDGGIEGWVEQRNVVTSDVYTGFQKLAADYANAPTQGRAVTRNAVNIHLTPNRDSDHLYQLADGEKVELLKRGTGEKPGAINAPRPAAAAPAKAPAPKGAAKSAARVESKSAAKTETKTAPIVESPEASEAALEDWWLVRDSQKHVGWVLARMVDIDVPVDVAQYAEGQRIVGAHVLNTVRDPGYEPESSDTSVPTAPAPATAAPSGDYHNRPQYLVLLTEPKDGLPFDYNQARVFTWNTKRHRYETAYREHGLFGLLPVTAGNENFDKEGTLPTFTLHVQDADGKTVERKYKLNGPIVRRVVVPGEEKVKMAALPKSEKKKGKPSVHRGRK